jgi:hypothetical protein
VKAKGRTPVSFSRGIKDVFRIFLGVNKRIVQRKRTKAKILTSHQQDSTAIVWM